MDTATTISIISLLISIGNGIIYFLTFIRERPNIKIQIFNDGGRIAVVVYNTGNKASVVVAARAHIEMLDGSEGTDKFFYTPEHQATVLQTNSEPFTRFYTPHKSYKITDLKKFTFILHDGYGKRHKKSLKIKEKKE